MGITVTNTKTFEYEISHTTHTHTGARTQNCARMIDGHTEILWEDNKLQSN